MNYTQNYHLGLPIPAERYDVSIVNANNTVIDGQMKTNANAITNHKNDHNNPHGVTAAQVGLGNVNNTADSAKPVSTPQSQYIASAVAAEATRATNAEGALSGRITTAAGEISAEVTRATGVESTLSTQITNEVTRAQGAESGLRDYVDEKLSVTYKASGSVFFADLPALAASREGHVYNIKDAFTTTADFVEGAGKDYPAGTNVAIIEKDEESYETATVEEGDNPSEMGLYELDGTDYILTEDTSPVEGKTYYELVVTPAYYYDVLSGFIDTSDFVTNTDYATTQAAGIVKPDGTTITVDANGVISSQGGGGDVSSEEMADVVNILGAKNLNSYPYSDGNSRTYRGITYKVDENGVIDVNGTATNDSFFIIHNRADQFELILPNGNYRLSGCPAGGSDESYLIGAEVLKNGEEFFIGEDTGDGGSITVDGDDDYTDKASVVLYIWIASGTSMNHAKFYPMIRPAHIEDDTFVPYMRTNKELTSDVAELKSKNLLYKTPGSQTVHGVTFTIDNDGIITANGTASDSISFYVGTFSTDDLSQKYVLSGISGGSYSTYWIVFGNHDYTNEGVFSGVDLSSVTIRINNGYTCDNLTFNLRIYPFDDLSKKYVPYEKSNKELTDDQVFTSNNFGVKNLLPNNAIGQTINGVTFTVDDNGIITFSGTSTADIEFPIFNGTLSFDYDVFISGDRFGKAEVTSHLSAEYGDGTIADFARLNKLPANTVIKRIFLFVKGSRTFNNEVYKPMICHYSTVDFTYVPYAKTNRQLTEDVETLQQTTFSDMTGATSSSDGTHGLVPAPLIADRGKFLRGDGAWQNIPNMTGATSAANGVSGLVPQPLIANRAQFLRGDGAWATPTIERSYVGMIIHSTTLNTMAKVVAFYGGTTWIQHSGYVLRGATSGVTANSATKTGGADTVTLATTQIPSHTHTQNAHQHKYGATYQYTAGSGSDWGYTFLKTKNADTGQGDYSTANTTATNQSTGGGQAHSTVPNYKSVYIWERTV